MGLETDHYFFLLGFGLFSRAILVQFPGCTSASQLIFSGFPCPTLAETSSSSQLAVSPAWEVHLVSMHRSPGMYIVRIYIYNKYICIHIFLEVLFQSPSGRGNRWVLKHHYTLENSLVYQACILRALGAEPAVMLVNQLDFTMEKITETKKIKGNIWMFPKIVVPPNHPF